MQLAGQTWNRGEGSHEAQKRVSTQCLDTKFVLACLPPSMGAWGEQKSSGVCGNKANGLVVFDASRVIPTCCETKPVFPRSRMRVVWPR